MIDKDLMFILKSEIRFHIILSLKDNPKSPLELTSKKFYMSHISSNLKNLVEKGYIECITPQTRKNKKFALTNKSKEIIKKLNELIN